MNHVDLRVPFPLSITVTHTGSVEVAVLGGLAPGDRASTNPGKLGGWKLSNDTDLSRDIPWLLSEIWRKSVPFAQLGQL